MIAIGNGEPCPFCKDKDKFVSQPDNDILQHLMDSHPDQLEEYLFGGKNIGVE
tara:strand:- start:6325 stop:6483 length:159 start_codon:yes stop_codon:yes gene_type:complete